MKFLVAHHSASLQQATNQRKSTNKFIAGRGKGRVRWFRSAKKTCQNSIYMIKLWVSIDSIPKFPTYSAKTSQKKHWKVHAFHGDIESSWNQHRSNRHQAGFHKILHRIRGDFSLAQPLLEQYHMNHVDEFHEFFEVGKKCIQNDG